MNIPSVKTLSTICESLAQAKELRALLAIQKASELTALIDARYPKTRAWIRSCYHEPSFHDMKMNACDELLRTYGVEYTPRGRNAKSPAIEYCNAGDTYTATLMFVNGRYRVGCWGDIAERGNYA